MSKFGVNVSCKQFIWDDELERNISSEPINSSGCNCSEIVNDLGCIIKDLEARKKEKINMCCIRIIDSKLSNSVYALEMRYGIVPYYFC